jgi:hypothetical protein
MSNILLINDEQARIEMMKLSIHISIRPLFPSLDYSSMTPSCSTAIAPLFLCLRPHSCV